MVYIDEAALGQKVSDLLLLPIKSEKLGRSDTISIRLRGIERPNGFSVQVSTGLQLVFAELIWDSFAQPMLKSISEASFDDWHQVESLQSALKKSGVTTALEVDGRPLDLSTDPLTQLHVSRFELRAQTLNWRGSAVDSAAEVAAATLAVLIALLPLDLQGLTSEAAVIEGEIEGMTYTGQVSRYERSRANRAIAILIHGTRCVVCGIQFSERYPGIGEGYVEIHHLLPLHLMESPEVVNPTTDLVPLCSNCHRMAHRADPPYAPEALRALLQTSPPRGQGPSLE